MPLGVLAQESGLSAPAIPTRIQDEPPVPLGDADPHKAGVFTKSTGDAAIRAAQSEPTDEGAPYPVSGFNLVYGTTEPEERPNLSEPVFQDLVVQLSQMDGGAYAAPGEGRPTVRLKLSEVTSAAPINLTRSGIIQVCRAVSAEFNRRGIFALFVAPSADDINERELRESGHPTDLRKGTSLTIVVWTGVVRSVRTIAGGERELDGVKVNHPAHALTLRNTPIKKDELLRKDKLDDYTYVLNRHPGRRVDAAVGAADEDGGVQLDYLVTENRPWTAYFQISNTGTKNTNEWRERFGFVHNQLTNNDDIFRIEYATAGFEASHAVSPSYEFPLMTNVLRAKLYASWSEFTASDVGSNRDVFRGKSWVVGGELIWTAAQFTDTFLDVIGGVRFESVKIEQDAIFGNQGEENFWLPYFGARVQRDTDASHTFAQVTYEFTANSGDRAEVDNLGRRGADTSWGLLRWDAEQSLYLEPLFNPSDPKYMTLAHEVAFTFRGQSGFDNQLIPSAQGVAGGFYSVRGYPESVTAGDSVYIASAEYRFHLPQALSSGPAGTLGGREFRYVPQGPYGRADWDLIFRGFVDYGHTITNQKLVGQADEDLLSVGVGAELQVLRNLNLRADIGTVLSEVNSDPRGGGQLVTEGSTRIHLSATLSF